MKAIILVGGEGTRLRPLTYVTPKQMLPVAGTAMLEWVVAHLAEHGVTELVLALGYLPEQFINAYPDHEVRGVPVTYVVEEHPLDTAGALHNAAMASGIDETFVVVNGDVMTDMSISALVQFHRYRRASASLAVRRVPDPSAFGVVDFTTDGRVRAFVEKPPRGTAPTDYINAGVYVLEPSVLERIEPNTRVSLERAVFPALARDQVLYARPTSDYWIDTGTPATYLQANLDVLNGRRPRPLVEPQGGSWIAPDSVVESGDVTRSVLGARSRVEIGAVVDESVLLPGAVVASGAVVRRSIIGPGAVVASTQRLSEAVIFAERDSATATVD